MYGKVVVRDAAVAADADGIEDARAGHAANRETAIRPKRLCPLHDANTLFQSQKEWLLNLVINVADYFGHAAAKEEKSVSRATRGRCLLCKAGPGLLGDA